MNIKLFEDVNWDDWDWEDENPRPLDLISIYISQYSIIITENHIKNKFHNYIYLDSVTEKDIPYSNNIMLNEKGELKDMIYINDGDSKEWLIKIDNRKKISKYKSFIEKCINDNLKEFFYKKDWVFILNDGFDIYPMNIEIHVRKFNDYINKYFFKN